MTAGSAMPDGETSAVAASDSTRGGTAQLVVSGLSAGYGGTNVVRDISLELHPGEVVCLLGRNGAGKTTIMKSLMGVLPRAGSVLLGAHETATWRGSRIKKAGMVCVPQDDQVVPGLTLADHFALAVPGSPIADVVEQAAAIFPVLGERQHQDAATLSGGERKMLGIALALACDPDVILLDEPTEGVAPVTIEHLVKTIASIEGDVAILLVEQNLDTALELGERAYVLETGSIVESGNLSELSASGRLEKRLAL